MDDATTKDSKDEKSRRRTATKPESKIATGGTTSAPTSDDCHEGFERDYWDTNFDEPDTMDGIVNAKEHVNYVHALFELEKIDVESIADFGFGFAVLFEKFIERFAPKRAAGIEPSRYMFERVSRSGVKVPTSCADLRVRLECTDLRSWCRARDERARAAERKIELLLTDRDLTAEEQSEVTAASAPDGEDEHDQVYDLGLCTSVFQYLNDEDLREVSASLSRHVRYLYMTVPTAKEMALQKRDYDFQDPYAETRTRNQYMDIFRRDWAFVSSRVLESKYYFDEDNTEFQNLLFRFA